MNFSYITWSVMTSVIIIAIIMIVIEKSKGKNSKHITYKGLVWVQERPKFIYSDKHRSSKNEETCRAIMERIFQKPFASWRPNFLKNPATGENLELDCYNSELKLAVEYDGIMHRKYTPFFHKSRWDFLYQKAKDDWKTNKCRDLGITLIRVPDYVKPEQLQSYLIRKLNETGRLKDA